MHSVVEEKEATMEQPGLWILGRKLRDGVQSLGLRRRDKSFLDRPWGRWGGRTGSGDEAGQFRTEY